MNKKKYTTGENFVYSFIVGFGLTFIIVYFIIVLNSFIFWKPVNFDPFIFRLTIVVGIFVSILLFIFSNYVSD